MTQPKRTLVVTILIGVTLFAALWFMAIAPKRSERSDVKADVAAQQARVDTARAQVASFTASRRQFAGLLTELRRLDKAVPSRGNVAAMLRELQRRAKARDSDLRIVALKDGAKATTPGAPGSTPGAVLGPGGLSALPFTFEYTGRYFDLLDILEAVRRSVRVTSGDLNIDGRLLTIDGLSFKPLDGDVKLTKAVLNATAYIAPDGAAAPQPPASPATPVTPAPTGGS